MKPQIYFPANRVCHFIHYLQRRKKNDRNIKPYLVRQNKPVQINVITLWPFYSEDVTILIDWIEVLWPSQPIMVMFELVSSPNHSPLSTSICAHSFIRKWQLPFLIQQKVENILWSITKNNVAEPGGDWTHDLLITSPICICLSYWGLHVTAVFHGRDHPHPLSVKRKQVSS